jgi:hypothetical protein
MYPNDFPDTKLSLKDPPRPASYLRLKGFHPRNGLPEYESAAYHHIPPIPNPSLFWGACFAFGPAQILKEVPYDPYCPYVFVGEETSMAARLFSHGWDTFAPTEMLCFHMWARNRPTFWEQFTGKEEVHKHRQQLEHQAYRRLRHVLGLQALDASDLPIGPYGLGRVRSLEQFQYFTGVNLLLQIGEPHAWMGLTRAAPTEEIMTKFGSVGAYYEAQTARRKAMSSSQKNHGV